MALDFLESEISALRARGLLRLPPDDEGELRNGRWDCSSNDYLGYARNVSRETSLGAGASRLIHGTTPEHLALEGQLARWVGAECAQLFSSGYAANVGVLQALAGSGDVILSDALNHASIIDGCRLSRADTVVLPHLDLGALAAALKEHRGRRCWVVTESYFSMDGDGPDLSAISALVHAHPAAALIVDEAHALGVFGPRGSGLCAESGIQPDVLVGTLGKAVGSSGAFVAGSKLLRLVLWNRARSLVFSTATSPELARASSQNVARCVEDDHGRTQLLANAAQLHQKLTRAGIPVPDHYRVGPIIPIVLGTTSSALQAAEALTARGFLAQAIRPPTVPEGTSRLRITLRPNLSALAIDELAELLIQAWTSSSSSAPVPTSASPTSAVG